MPDETKKELMGLIKMLIVALLACAGIHTVSKLAGCAAQPAYAIGVHAAVASDEDLLPKTGGFSRASGPSSSASTRSPASPSRSSSQQTAAPEQTAPAPASPSLPPPPVPVAKPQPPNPLDAVGDAPEEPPDALYREESRC